MKQQSVKLENKRNKQEETQKMKEAANGEGLMVCVTGASGYIASWLVKLLLLRGYTVNATVRDPNDPAKTDHLMRLEGAKERLHLFKADLMQEGSFDSAISGCKGVFHTASPVIFNVNDPQADLLDPATKGTLNVLGACKKAPSVTRVILTSSFATVLLSGRPLAPDVVVDETWFSKPEYCHQLPKRFWYAMSKIMAEEAAWKFCKENGIELVSMNPGTVIGPMLQPTLNGTAAKILHLINGAKTYPNEALPWVHVKDVAEAHIRAFEIPSACGRYCVAETVVHYSDIVDFLHELYPSLQLPADKSAGGGPLAKTYQVSKAKVKCLGIIYTPLKESLKDMVESLKENKYLQVTST